MKSPLFSEKFGSAVPAVPAAAPPKKKQVLHGVFHHGKDHAIQDTPVTAQVALQVGVEDIYIGPATRRARGQ